MLGGRRGMFRLDGLSWRIVEIFRLANDGSKAFVNFVDKTFPCDRIR